MSAATKETVVPKQLTIIEQIASRRSAFPLQELANLTGSSYNALWDMANRGILPVMRIGGSIRLDPKTIAEWLRQRTSP